MRHRLYFVLPNLSAARRTLEDLLVARIEERYIHCVAKPGVSMEGLHEANVLQTTDLIHGAELGMVIGGLGGAVLGALIVFAPPGGIDLQPVTLLLTTVGGAFFGAWASSLTAARIPNSRLTGFKQDIESGKYLLMVDVPNQRVEEICALVGERHPEAIQHGVEPAIPAFP
ncbi:MAG: DUF1269 domain-containing protein [Pseudomonadota bacterium]